MNSILSSILFPCITAFAEGEAQAPAQDVSLGAGSMLSPVIMMVGVIVLMYFMLIRPQKKKEKETKAMIDAMKVGDKVVSIGGICGKVSKIKDEFVIIETGNIGTQAEKSFIKLERDSIKTVETKKTV